MSSTVHFISYVLAYNISQKVAIYTHNKLLSITLLLVHLRECLLIKIKTIFDQRCKFAKPELPDWQIHLRTALGGLASAADERGHGGIRLSVLDYRLIRWHFEGVYDILGR
jgi:hypothetical protein